MSIYTVDPATDLVHTFNGIQTAVKFFLIQGIVIAPQIVILKQTGPSDWTGIVSRTVDDAALASIGPVEYLKTLIPFIQDGLNIAYGGAVPPDQYAALAAAFKAYFQIIDSPHGPIFTVK